MMDDDEGQSADALSHKCKFSTFRRVRSDEHGIFIFRGTYRHRPGEVGGKPLVYPMDDGGLVAGDKVMSCHVAGTTLMRLKMADGSYRLWESDLKHARLRELLAKEQGG